LRVYAARNGCDRDLVQFGHVRFNGRFGCWHSLYSGLTRLPRYCSSSAGCADRQEWRSGLTHMARRSVDGTCVQTTMAETMRSPPTFRQSICINRDEGSHAAGAAVADSSHRRPPRKRLHRVQSFWVRYSVRLLALAVLRMGHRCRGAAAAMQSGWIDGTLLWAASHTGGVAIALQVLARFHRSSWSGLRQRHLQATRKSLLAISRRERRFYPALKIGGRRAAVASGEGRICGSVSMRVYLWVVVMIVGLMGAYLALVPMKASSDASKLASTTGPF
jgi:hypothetical protein